MDDQTQSDLKKQRNDKKNTKDELIQKSADSTFESNKKRKDDSEVLFDINTIKNMKFEKFKVQYINVIKPTFKFDFFHN